MGDLGGALADLDRSIALDPDGPLAYGNRAAVYMALGDYPSAIDDLGRQAAISPQDPGVYSRRAQAYTLAGRADLAREDLRTLAGLGFDTTELEEALDLDPADPGG